MTIFTDNRRIRLPLLSLLLSLFLVNCTGATRETDLETDFELSSEQSGKENPPQNQTLRIWWNRSYYIQEDEAIEAAIAKWEQQTGNKIELSLTSQDDTLKNTQKALDADNPPDIVFANIAADTRSPRWAWEGKLADVSDVVEPIQNIYSATALQSVYLYNHKTQKPSIYGVPINQRSVHAHYWRDLLTEAGWQEQDIPQEWDDFWAFWHHVRKRLQADGREEIYALGLPMSSEAIDTYLIFEQILEAYDVRVVDEEGNLLLDEPQTRQQIIEALTWYVDFYREGFVPPDAIDWSDSDNNKAFLNQRVLLTVNPTLSIPGALREDEPTYRDRMATIEFPNEPDGESPRYVSNVQHVLLFADSPHQETAKAFLSYLIQPENLASYLEGSLGRFFPVMPELAARPFWNDPQDPHISVATQQFQPDKTRPTYSVLNPAYASVQSENIWGRAIESIATGEASPEAAADKAIARIQEIFAEWER